MNSMLDNSLLLTPPCVVQGTASHLGDRSQGAKPSTLTGLGPTASSKAMLGIPRSSGLAEGRGAGPAPAASRRSSMPEDIPVSSGPTPLTLSFSVPSTDKAGYASQETLAASCEFSLSPR